MRAYLGDSSSVAPTGSRSERTAELFEVARGVDSDERQRLLEAIVVENLPVARSIAARYRGRGVAFDDLEQVARMGLVRAAQRFDPDQAPDFLSFAVPTIRGEVKRYFRDHGWMVRPPRRVQEVQTLLARDSKSATGADEAPEVLAARLGVSAEDVRRAQEAQGCFSPSSLDAPVGRDSETQGSFLVDGSQTRDWEAAEARVMLRDLTNELQPRDRLIIYLRYVEGRTQSEIGQELGITQMQVSRLLTRIHRTLRTQLTGEPVDSSVA